MVTLYRSLAERLKLIYANHGKTARLFTFESRKKLWMKQQILWTAIEINERRTVEREAPSREMRRERTAVERAARIVAA
ncbi:hypothetical protein DY000_02030539 [Brassica cretica]|uniref:Uncharacterized protein n=1 Tax=Brassica cretica TaxID=69181 RepID=A0ABQ7DDU9_BRACR|nr:hypothetical protein DY000_02030539 [Brassica cretica]